MKLGLPIVVLLVVVTVGLMFAGLAGARGSNGTVGIATGSALPGVSANPSTPEQAIADFLLDVKRRNWDRAYSALEHTDDSGNEEAFIQEWMGSNGGLRSFSSLESYQARPLHATDSDAQMRVRLRWATPVGPVEDVRDFHLRRRADQWKLVWEQTPAPNVPAQIVPVNYLRWDLVSGSAGEEWGSHNLDAPHVRLISMNAIDTAEGAVVIGEVVNEDTIPAFVNVNAVLVDAAGSALDDESSFDKILHVLLPKQVSPYRIDFPQVSLSQVKNVRMDVKATLVPASSDPVIGVDSVISSALPAGGPSRISVNTTSASSRSTIRCAVVEPTNPPPTTVTFFRISSFSSMNQNECGMRPPSLPRPRP